MKYRIFYNTLYQFVNMLIVIIIAPYLSRVIGADGVGLYSYTKAITGYFILFAMQGLNQYGSRSIALVKNSREDLSKSFWEIYLVQFINSMLVVIVYSIYVLLYSGVYKIALMINIIYVFSALFDINWFYFGIGEFKLTATRNIFIKIVSVIMIFVFVKSEKDVILYIVISTVGMLTANIVLWLYLGRHIVWVPVSIKQCIKHVKPNLVLFIAVLAISVYRLMDKVMLGTMSNVTQNGYYEVMSDIITIPLSIITAMGTVMQPKISELVKEGESEKILGYNRDTIQMMLGVSIPFSIGIICVADNFVPLYFGESFREGALVLKLLAVTSPFLAFENVIRTQCVIPLKKDIVYVQATLLAAITNFVINYLLIPRYGAVGAAIGTIVAEVLVLFYLYGKMFYSIKKLKIIRDNIEFLLSGIIMGGIICLLNNLSLGNIFILVVQVVSGIIIYIGLNYIYFYKFDKERYIHWQKILRERRNA